MPSTNPARITPLECRGRPDGLDLMRAATVPRNGLAAEQILNLLGDVSVAGNRLLITGAAGALGGYLLALAPDRGWDVTGMARPRDEAFVRSLGADFTEQAEPGWDAVADSAVYSTKHFPLSVTAARSSASSRATSPPRSEGSASPPLSPARMALGWLTCFPKPPSATSRHASMRCCRWKMQAKRTAPWPKAG
jgi:hypothetical protein